MPTIDPRHPVRTVRSVRGAGRRRVPRIVVPTARAVIDCGVYVEGRRVPGRFTPADALAEIRNRGEGFVWVGLIEPDDTQMGEIAAIFDLHPLAVEDAINARQRPKLERYDDTLVLVLRTVVHREHEMHSVSEIIETGQIMIFTSPDFVVTVRHGDHCALTGVRRELEADPARLMYGAPAVLHAVTDHVVDSYVDVTDAVELDIEAMEEEVFTPRSQVAVESIYQLKREVVELRRAVNPLATPLGKLLNTPDLVLPKEIRRYLRDVTDHHSGVAERITDLDEALTALISAALAKIGVQQNTDMRTISAVVAIAAVPTMIAGIYGMNFEHMPELRQVWGYPAALILIFTLCTGLFIGFRHNKWL
ncbi:MULTISPECIES: magnesium and cobalt transport protein CorA [Nocardia]|uniref:magnesium and cobalt transport protein CorA n=1 Tax=Nocardia TaxID=1817 RepID=UPI000D690455|nr:MULTISPECIES: magnesium and cobalt transport protein CorA [Nocardia]